MIDENPYQPPEALVDTVLPGSDDTWDFVSPQSVPIGRGLSWLSEGIRFFLQSPWLWLLITLIETSILLVSSLIPFVPLLLFSIFNGGLMGGLFEQDNNRELKLRQLFDGFNVQTGSLAMAGFFQLCISILLVIMFLFLVYAALYAFFSGVLAYQNTVSSSFLLIISLAMVVGLLFLFVVILYCAIVWFSSPLIMLHKLSAGEALKMSLLALKRNIGPFFVLTLIALPMIAIASLPFFLGWLILIPILYGAIYASWKDIFTRATVR